MPKYIANSYLVHQGKVVQTGNQVELTEKQAERLGKKVSIVEGGGEKEDVVDATSLKKLSADEQKALVEELGGNLEELTNEEKRVQFILENQ